MTRQPTNQQQQTAILPLPCQYTLNKPPPNQVAASTNNIAQIKMFGRFEIHFSGHSLNVREAKSTNVRQLLAYFVLHRQQGYINSDTLMELCWPGESPIRSKNRLHVALSQLRKVLEPTRQRGEKSHYLLTSNGGYRLQLPDHVKIDVETFSHHLHIYQQQAHIITTKTDSKHNNKIINHLLRAETLYRGDLLAEEPRTDWCETLKTHYRQRYLDTLQNISLQQEQQEHNQAIIERMEKYITIERYNEIPYRLLMRTYAKLHNIGRVNELFARCRDAIENDLGEQLSEDICQEYHSLIMG